ncbi:MAG: cyclomaltodextrinase N-terminal domain-containing protein, partial [Candidatus Dadabacteria bacterium]
MRKPILLFVLVSFSVIAACQSSPEVYPGHWWVGMKNHQLQLMIHEKEVAKYNLVMDAYPGIKLMKVNKVENPNYLFVDLLISSTAKPGNIQFHSTNNNGLKFS